MPLAKVSRACKPGFASELGVLNDISAGAAMSPIAMVRDFDVNSVQLKVSQKSVLQQMLSRSLYISLFESFTGIALL